MHFRPDIVSNASLLVAAVAEAAGGAFNAVHYRCIDLVQPPNPAALPGIT